MPIRSRRYLALLSVCGLLGACATGIEGRPAAADLADLNRARTLIGPKFPVGPAVRSTTSGEIYLENLTGQISVLEKRLKTQSNDILLVRLAMTVYHRFQITGVLADAERARRLLSSAYQRPHGPAVDLAYAKVLAGFHEFGLASQALRTAAANGADTVSVAAMRRAVERSTGTLAADNVSEQQRETGSLSPTELVTLAGERLERGQAAAASELLKMAQDRYQSSAPYLLAWIHLQQGIVFLRHRDFRSAHIFFAAAHERFPQYVLATEHLAETEMALGNHATAAQLYRGIAARTDSPEFYYRLSRAEHALGNIAAADAHARQAAAGYQSLIDRYPLMYADHATHFYIETGKVLAGLRLAEANFAARQDVHARILLMESYLAAGANDLACEQYRSIVSDGFDPPELTRMALACEASG